MRASVWLTGLMLLVGGYAVLLLLAQTAISVAAPTGGSTVGRSFVPSWGSATSVDRPAPEAAGIAGSGIRFNQDPAGPRVSIGPGQAEPDLPTAPAALSGLPAEMLTRSAEHTGLVAGLTWIIGLSAAAALLRRA